MIEFDANSNDHLSILFFSGALKSIEVQPELKDGMPVVFKSGLKKGQIRTKKVEVLKRIEGFNLDPLPEWKAKKEGFYHTNEDVLAVISELNGSEKDLDAAKAAKLLLDIRGIKKQLSTYYTGIEELIYPDGCVRGQYQHVITPTLRLSCTSPNLQNQPSVDLESEIQNQVKYHFKSRY